MIDIEKEYASLQKKLKKYKTKKLGFECGCVCGYVTKIERPSESLIEIYGYAGLNPNERLLMQIDRFARKGKDYRYYEAYHILEYFPQYRI